MYSFSQYFQVMLSISARSGDSIFFNFTENNYTIIIDSNEESLTEKELHLKQLLQELELYISFIMLNIYDARAQASDATFTSPAEGSSFFAVGGKLSVEIMEFLFKHVLTFIAACS